MFFLFAVRLSLIDFRPSSFVLHTLYFFFTAYCNCALSTNFVPRTSYLVFRTLYQPETYPRSRLTALTVTNNCPTCR